MIIVIYCSYAWCNFVMVIPIIKHNRIIYLCKNFDYGFYVWLLMYVSVLHICEYIIIEQAGFIAYPYKAHVGKVSCMHIHLTGEIGEIIDSKLTLLLYFS